MSSVIFEPGQICGGRYLIERAFARSPITETYLARDIVTGQEALLTCSTLDDSSKRLRASFLANVARLRAIKAESSPRVLAGDVTDSGVWWVAREHFADAIPLLDLITSDALVPPFLARLHLGIVRADVASYLFVILTVAVKVAKTLRRFAAHGFYHGGLDPAETIALRGDGTLVVFDAGYRELFGASYFEDLPTVASCRAPESSVHRTGDARGDIYALGFILQGILGLGIVKHRLQPLPSLVSQLEPMTHPNPSKRLQGWDDVLSVFEAPYDELLTKVVHRAKAGDGAPNAVPQANEPAPESDRQAIAEAPPSKGDDATEPTSSVLTADAPISIEAHVDELAAGGPSSESDEAPTPQAPASGPVGATRPEVSSAGAPAARPRPKKERAPLSRFLWVAGSAVSVLVGIVALRTAPLVADRVLDTRSSIENARPWSASPTKSDIDQNSRRARGDEPPPRLIVDRRRSWHEHSCVPNAFKWTTSSEIMSASRRLTNQGAGERF